MDKLGGRGFNPNLGVAPLRDGFYEIGRANLPESARVLPESVLREAAALVYDRLTDSSILEMFGDYLAPDVEHRELLSPDAFFECLENAANALVEEARERGADQNSPEAVAAMMIGSILEDHELCEMLKNLLMQA